MQSVPLSRPSHAGVICVSCCGGGSRGLGLWDLIHLAAIATCDFDYWPENAQKEACCKRSCSPRVPGGTPAHFNAKKQPHPSAKWRT